MPASINTKAFLLEQLKQGLENHQHRQQCDGEFNIY